MKTFKGYFKGINLGGWFSQCDNSEDTYDNFIRKEDFAVIKSWGLDHVRIPVDYELFKDEKGFERLDDAILTARENDLNVVLDLHKTYGYSFDDKEGENGFFEDEELQNKFYDLWSKLTERFSKYSDHLAFELLNEVTDIAYKDKWNAIASKAIKLIREQNKDIHIIIGGYYNNSVVAVKDIDVPFDDKIVLNFHCYEPLLFTHQGAYWIKEMPVDFRMNYHTSFREYQQIGEKFKNYMHIDSGIKNVEDTPSPEFFENLFKEAIDFAKEKDLPLYCGEYGVIELADVSENLKWLNDIHAVFKKYGIGHALWTYRAMDFDFCNPRYDEIRAEAFE